VEKGLRVRGLSSCDERVGVSRGESGGVAKNSHRRPIFGKVFVLLISKKNLNKKQDILDSLRFTAKCDKIERKFGIAVLERYSSSKPWHEQQLMAINSDIRIIDRESEPNLNIPLLRESLGTICNNVLDTQLLQLMRATIPTTRYLTYSMCVKHLNKCEEQSLVTQMYQSPTKADIERFREKGKKALANFWAGGREESERKRRLGERWKTGRIWFSSLQLH